MIKNFDDRKSISLFVKAINKGKRMSGSLDFGAIFLMTFNMKNEERKQYHLNIMNTERSQTGMYLKLPNTETGYKLSKKTSERLKKLIYESNIKGP